VDNTIRRGGEDIMNQSNSTKCRFCHFFNEQPSDSIDSPWLRDDDYCAIVSKGALVPGWSLVCPLEHGHSLAANYQRADFWSFASRAASLVAERYGDVAVFEHGAGYAGSPTGCGTDHSHLHLVPLNFNLATEAMRFDASLKWSRCRAAEIAARTQGREYLFVSDRMDGAETEGLVCLLDKPVSQFFRRVIASRIGLREFYDYKTHPMLDIAASSAHDLRSDAIAGDRVDVR
jgi:ATP adenylyltransferase